MNLEQIHRVYLIGIGGIGMSALARYFHRRGCLVSGYDRTPTPLTAELQEEGIEITFNDHQDAIPAAFKDPVKFHETLVIYTPAIPADNDILGYFRQYGFALKKRSEVLGIISRSMFTIAVAGTHGKTTTSTLIAHILKHSGHNCSAFLGGISVNYNTNVLFGDNNVLVVEADEYDRSFLTLHPDIAIITSMDADHLDIYQDKLHMDESFRLFANQVSPNGKLIYKHGLQVDHPGLSYALEGMAYANGRNIRVEGGNYYFDYKDAEREIMNIRIGIPGWHNVENAIAAICTALHLGVSEEKIRSALSSFTGVKRRFEYIIRNKNLVYIDDYAHHPEELRACISSVRQLYPRKRLTVVFQPHLYTRTRDFADGFAEVLGMGDELIMLDIYPARELPIKGVNSRMVLDKVALGNKMICSKKELIKELKNRKLEVLLTVGAGDIDQFVEPLRKEFDR